MSHLEHFLIDQDITSATFACDLKQCKGACCTMPGQLGAPLLDEEVEEIEKAYPIVRKYLSFQHKDTIEERGLIQGRAGDHSTQVVNRKACVFAFFEDGIAKCSFERAFIDGELEWRKPLSCHLFPIRVDPGTIQRLRYEQIAECRPAVERGKQEGIRVWEFLRSALIREYGEEWYEELSSRTSKVQGDRQQAKT